MARRLGSDGLTTDCDSHLFLNNYHLYALPGGLAKHNELSTFVTNHKENTSWK